MTSTSTYGELVERAAVAIYKMMAAKDPNPTKGETWDNIYPDVRESLRQIAKTALEEAAQALRIYEEENGRLRGLLEPFARWSENYRHDSTVLWLCGVDRRGRFFGIQNINNELADARDKLELDRRQAILTKEDEGEKK